MGRASGSMVALPNLTPGASVSLSVDWAQGPPWFSGHCSDSRPLPLQATLSIFLFRGLTPSREGGPMRSAGWGQEAGLDAAPGGGGRGLARLEHQLPHPTHSL